MLFDLFSTDMYVSYNIKLAKILNLTAAIYISELINIQRKAIEKEKLKDGFFKLDRKYIDNRTTLSKADQKDIDAKLKELKILSIGESADLLKLDLDVLTSLILGDQEIVSEIVQPVKRGRPSKQESIVRQLKANIETTNGELKQAYEDWIDSVCAKNGWMTKIHVLEGQKAIDNYNKEKDLDLALEIIKIATMGGYRDMNWAIDAFEKKYKKDFNSKFNTQPTPVQKPRLKMSNEVF